MGASIKLFALSSLCLLGFAAPAHAQVIQYVLGQDSSSNLANLFQSAPTIADPKDRDLNKPGYRSWNNPSDHSTPWKVGQTWKYAYFLSVNGAFRIECKALYRGASKTDLLSECKVTADTSKAAPTTDIVAGPYKNSFKVILTNAVDVELLAGHLLSTTGIRSFTPTNSAEMTTVLNLATGKNNTVARLSIRCLPIDRPSNRCEAIIIPIAP